MADCDSEDRVLTKRARVDNEVGSIVEDSTECEGLAGTPNEEDEPYGSVRDPNSVWTQALKEAETEAEASKTSSRKRKLPANPLLDPDIQLPRSHRNGMIEIITPENPKDFFISGINVYNRPKPECTLDDQISKAVMHAKESRGYRRDPKDRFTAYLYGTETTIQVPIEKHCYIRVPDAWVVYQNSQSFVNGFLDNLVRTLLPRQASAFRSTIRASLVFRRHGVGYKPKVTNPPTADSASFLFLHVFCSNPCLYGLIKSKMSSNTAKRKFWGKDFYKTLFRGSAANKYLLTFRNPFGVRARSNVAPDANFLDNPKYYECFVAHETDINADTMALSNLGITSNGWVRITRGQLFDNRLREKAVSTSTYEITGNVVATGIPLSEIEETKCGEMTELALDIECNSVSRGFPQFTNAGDVVNYISLVKYSALDMDKAETHCLCLGELTTRDTDDGKTVDTAHMHVFEHETELLNYVPKFICENNVDILQTYNGNNFDWKYLDGRATIANFVQRCDDLDMFLRCVKSYHKAHLKYKDLQGALVDLEESFQVYQEINVNQYNEQCREIYGEINETLGFGKAKAWREPQPKTVHHALWGLWPKEFVDTPDHLKAANEEAALRKAEEMYQYFSVQPPIKYHYMHRLRAVKGELVYKVTGSKAMGENSLTYPDLGRVHVDQFSFFKNSLFRLNDYKLNSVAKHFLKVSKYDMPYKQLFEDYESGDPDKRRKIADYGVQDSDLLRRLDQYTNVSLTYIFLFKMTRTPMIDLSLRGQQIRVFNCLYKKAVSVGAIFNSKRAHKILQDYQGATVLDPVPGLHGGPDTWVQVLDFQSLYPSIIIAMLLCMMNLVLPDDVNYVLSLEKAGKIPPLHRVKIDDKTTYYFSRNPQCIIASELRRLLEKRKAVKRTMKGFGKAKNKAQAELDMLTVSFLELKKAQIVDQLAGDDVEEDDRLKLEAEIVDWEAKIQHVADWEARDADELEAVKKKLKDTVAENAHQYKMQDVLQLSIKIVMNSFYGFFGVKEGMMPGMQPIAVSTTFYGRDYIQRTKQFLQNLFDTHPDYEKLNMEVVYGDTDSVFVKTWPIPNLTEAVRIGKDMGLRTTRDEFKGAIILEFEKVANPHLAFEEKKSYLQRVWTTDKIDEGYVYISGVVEKRRDNSAFTRKMYHECRETIIPPIPKGATEIHFDTVEEIENRCAVKLADELGKLEDDVVPIDDYVITKSLSRAPENYKQPVQAHVALALRIKERIRTGEVVRMPPISGDRLPYVVCEHPTSEKVSDKVEDVDYFKDKQDKCIDRQYYAKASVKSMTQLYSAIMDVTPFFEATKHEIETQRLVRKGQTRLSDGVTGARSIPYQHLFKSRKPSKRKVTQLDIFGNEVKAAPKKKKKARKKKRAVKPRFKPLF